MTITVEPGACTLIPSHESIEVAGLGVGVLVAAFLSQNGVHVPPKSKSKLWVNGTPPYTRGIVSLSTYPCVFTSSYPHRH